MCDPLPLLYVRYTTWGQLSLCRDFGADERHVFAPIGLQDAMIIKNPYILYTYIYIYNMISLPKQNDSNPQTKGRFSTGDFFNPKKFPRTKGMPQSCLMTSVSWVWPVPWHAWCRGTATDHGEQLQLSSRRPQGVRAALGRTKCVQNHENPPQMWHKSTISHGKKPC